MGRCERPSSTRWFSDRRLCVNSGCRRAIRTWSRRRCQRDGLAIFSELPRKIAGSNNGEAQALAFADESLCLARLAWSEMHGAPMRRWHLDEAVRQVGGKLITDSRGVFDALTRSESPQIRLRSSRTCEEARGIKEQCAVSDARIHSVNTLTMLADSLTKPGYPVRAMMDSFLVKKRWRCTFDLLLRLANVGKQEQKNRHQVQDTPDTRGGRGKHTGEEGGGEKHTQWEEGKKTQGREEEKHASERGKKTQGREKTHTRGEGKETHKKREKKHTRRREGKENTQGGEREKKENQKEERREKKENHKEGRMEKKQTHKERVGKKQTHKEGRTPRTPRGNKTHWGGGGEGGRNRHPGHPGTPWTRINADL